MDYTKINDTDLFKFLQEDNQEAFAEIYNRYWKTIYYVAIKYTKSNQLAQDLVQDIFLKIWVNRTHNFAHVKDFKSYLLITARNQIISAFRKKVLYQNIENIDIIEEEILLPDKQLFYKELLVSFNKSIGMLPRQQKKVYQLRREEKLKYHEIAKLMGISVSTTKNHMSKAILFIRNQLTDKNAYPMIILMMLIVKNKNIY